MHDTIKSQIPDAMRAKDTVRLNTLRGLVTAFTNELISKGKMPTDRLTDEEAITVVKRAVKQRKDSIEQFESGGRPELAEGEKAELAILQSFLPAEMSREDIKAKALALKESMQADKSKMGPFMGALMKELKGQADGMLVKEVVAEIL